MKGIKVIEESRFLSKDTMEMVKGGLTCEKGNIYKLCNSGGYILCGAYSYKQCYNMHELCSSYSDSTGGLCSIDDLYNKTYNN